MTDSPAPSRPGARTTTTRCVSDDLRHVSSALRFRRVAVTAKIVGAVASYLNENPAPLTFPALSLQDPTRAAATLSGPAYCAEEQPASPEVASAPENETVRGWLYQPFASGGRVGTAAADGAVLSSLIVTLLIVSSPPLDAEQVIFVPAVSALSVLASHPVEISAPTTVQLTVTLLRYQPFAPSVPKMETVISGGLAEACGVTSSVARRAHRRTRRRDPRRRSECNDRRCSRRRDSPLLPCRSLREGTTSLQTRQSRTCRPRASANRCGSMGPSPELGAVLGRVLFGAENLLPPVRFAVVEGALGLRDVACELGFLGREALLELRQLLLASLQLVGSQLDVCLEARLAGVERGFALVEVDHAVADLVFALGEPLLLALEALGLRLGVVFGVVERGLAVGQLTLALLEAGLEEIEVAT